MELKIVECEVLVKRDSKTKLKVCTLFTKLCWNRRAQNSVLLLLLVFHQEDFSPKLILTRVSKQIHIYALKYCRWLGIDRRNNIYLTLHHSHSIAHLSWSLLPSSYATSKVEKRFLPNAKYIPFYCKKKDI